MIASIHQPNFMPWLGYFDKVMKSQQVVIFDSVQVSSGKSYSSRVLILLNGKEHWLSLPIKRAGNFGQKICEVELLDYKINWRKNLGSIRQAYAKAPFFKEVFPLLEEFMEEEHTHLAQFNKSFIQKITKRLGGEHVIFVNSSHNADLMKSESSQTDYIVETCLAFGIKKYLTGTGGSAGFLEKEKFAENGIELLFQKFTHPQYKQRGTEEFVPGLSVIDCLMNNGFDKTSEFIR